MGLARFAMVSVALTAALATSATHAAPLPNIDNYDLRTGCGINMYTGNMSYSAATGLATYAHSTGADSSYSYYCGPDFVEFAGVFAWSAFIDSDGRVTDPGSMLLLGDLGSGLEVLASGQLADVGAGFTERVTDLDDFEGYLIASLQFHFELGFLHPRISRLGNSFLFLHEVMFMTPVDTPYKDDFVCGAAIETGFCVGAFSDSGIVGRVPEPAGLMLLGIGLAGLGLGRRRRK